MATEKAIEIPFNKSRLAISLLAVLYFFYLGVRLVRNSPGLADSHPAFSKVMIVVGVVCMVIGVIVAWILVPELLNRRHGLIINREGITDNSSALAVGLIPWADILEIRVVRIVFEKTAMIIVRNPEDYLNRATSAWRRWAMQRNYRSYGSPISIASGYLKISKDELHQLLVDKLNENKA